MTKSIQEFQKAVDAFLLGKDCALSSIELTQFAYGLVGIEPHVQSVINECPIVTSSFARDCGKFVDLIKRLGESLTDAASSTTVSYRLYTGAMLQKHEAGRNLTCFSKLLG